MMKASVTATSVTTYKLPATPSGLMASDSKFLDGLVSTLPTRDTELTHSGLLRSVTAEAGEIAKGLALNAERAALILLIQNMITGYVMVKEGRANYKGRGHYDLAYIQDSTHIQSHRKQDIQAIDGLLKEAESKALPPISLASALFKYLNQIKTGVNFLWLRIGNSSDLRSHIHMGLKGFDPVLYWVCFIDQVDDYQSYQAQRPDAAKLRLARSMEAEISKTAMSFEKYQILRKALTKLKRDLADVESKYADLEEKNVGMSSLVNRQSARIYELEMLTGMPSATARINDSSKTEAKTTGDASIRREASKMAVTASA